MLKQWWWMIEMGQIAESLKIQCDQDSRKIIRYGDRIQLLYGTAEEVARFQRLFPDPSRLTSGRTSNHQNLVSIFPGIANCLKAKPYWLVDSGCLPYAVGKQPSIPLINLGIVDVKMMMMIIPWVEQTIACWWWLNKLILVNANVSTDIMMLGRAIQPLLAWKIDYKTMLKLNDKVKNLIVSWFSLFTTMPPPSWNNWKK